MFLTCIALILVIFITGYLYLPMFGATPKGSRLELTRRSAHFKDGRFQNLEVTPDLTEGANLVTVLNEFIFRKDKRNKPGANLPSTKMDLLTLDSFQNILVWFGHSSYFMQVDGKTILVDPVLGGAASPIRATTRSFPGTDVYKADDIPPVDYLFISHDHWDHLDYPTIVQLRSRVRHVICGLGVGQHFTRWGYDPACVHELDWGGALRLDDLFYVDIVPARHFSGRGLRRNRSLWVSFVLHTPSRKIFLGGDSGYGTHFKMIGDQFGPFDLAILECGQYDKSWKYIHMMPEEVVTAAVDLQAALTMPVHWGKFSLANHAWDDPAKRVTAAAQAQQLALLMPRIGELINLDKPPVNTRWWANID